MILIRQPPPPYGPSNVPGEGSQALKERFPNTIASCSAQIDFIAKELGGRNVVELECLAAALYVTLKAGETESPASRAPMLRRLKPHVSERKAEEAIAEVDSIAQRARSLRSEVGQPSG